jgi:integrase
MKRALPLHVTETCDRHGKWRLRYRCKGFKTYYFKARIGTADFEAELAACRAGEIPKIEPGIDRIATGSINDLVTRYYRSQDFLGGSAMTQRKNRGILEAFRSEWGRDLVLQMQFEHVDAILAKKAAQFPAAARNLRKQLRRLMSYAVKCRMRDDNPVEHTARIKSKSTGWHAWTETEIAQYQATHAKGTMARLALELYLWTGNRKTDALTLGRQHIKDGAFRIRQQKTGKTLIIPIAPALADAIMATPVGTNMTLLTNAYGNAFTSAGFGNRMRKWCDDAGLPQCTTHGLRKAISNRMALSGAGNQGIKSITGHSGDSEVAHYTREVDQEALARATMSRLVAWELANLPVGLAIHTDNQLKDNG